MNLGKLKNYTLSAKKELFNKESIDNQVVIAIEDWYGNIVQAFCISAEENMVKILEVLNKEISTDIEDYGVKIDLLGSIKYLNNVLEVADRDVDDLFNTNCDMLRLQMKNEIFKQGLYEVVISQTETKAGKIYVYADSKEEAEDIIDEEKDYYFEILEDTKEANCMHYDIEVHSVEEIDKKELDNSVTFVDEGECLNKKESMSSSEIEEMCSSIDLMNEKLFDVLGCRNIRHVPLSRLLIDIMDLSSEIKCELDEDDENSKLNAQKHIEEIQLKIENFLKSTIR